MSKHLLEAESLKHPPIADQSGMCDPSGPDKHLKHLTCIPDGDDSVRAEGELGAIQGLEHYCCSCTVNAIQPDLHRVAWRPCNPTWSMCQAELTRVCDA
jgi:hypothetical protein